jgi:hypothetical protein
MLDICKKEASEDIVCASSCFPSYVSLNIHKKRKIGNLYITNGANKFVSKTNRLAEKFPQISICV